MRTYCHTHISISVRTKHTRPANLYPHESQDKTGGYASVYAAVREKILADEPEVLDGLKTLGAALQLCAGVCTPARHMPLCRRLYTRPSHAYPTRTFEYAAHMHIHLHLLHSPLSVSILVEEIVDDENYAAGGLYQSVNDLVPLYYHAMEVLPTCSSLHTPNTPYRSQVYLSAGRGGFLSGYDQRPNITKFHTRHWHTSCVTE